MMEALETDLTAREVATALRLHVATVQRLLASGRLQGYRIGGKYWRVPRASVEDFKRRGEVRPIVRPVKVSAGIQGSAGTGDEEARRARQREQNQGAIALLHAWQHETDTEDEGDAVDILQALDQDRLSDRPLFPQSAR
jgi:excisionase family DNA binding protein